MPMSAAPTVPIVDTHNDLLLELVHRSAEPAPFATHWLPHLQQGGVILQVCPLFAARPEWLPEQGLRRVLGQVAAFERAVRENPQRLVAVRSGRDLPPRDGDGRIRLMLSMEGVEALGNDVELIDIFWLLGVRVVGLTWNTRNAFADGSAEPSSGGLSRLGERLVDRLVQLGAILDLAHASEQTFTDVVERSGGARLLVSHAACRGVFETPRNLSDEQLRCLADCDGMLGLMLLPSVIDSARPTIDRAVDHVDHAVEVMGISRVGFGGDFFDQVRRALGWEATAASLQPVGMPYGLCIDGLKGPEDYPALTDALSRRGYSDEQIQALACHNFLDFFHRTLPR
jgi:membrane dipeptidase